ncbi:hypothetical protein [Streptomyces sp. NPDC127098]|uniref:hypothetical protein n=1 Tax=Streptomyces sp. NPDC127098 TaxID=3347137 RepID=UPI003654B864
MTRGLPQPDAAARAVGFIGLGDQDLPMATAIAQTGHTLHVWALTQASDVVLLCGRTDEDVLIAPHWRHGLRQVG